MAGFPVIDPRAVVHWHDCLYAGHKMFGTNSTTDVVYETADRLREYARGEHAQRVQSPYGDVYYQELDTLDLGGCSVLEFGCGAGMDTLYFAEHGAKVTACDIVPSNVLMVGKMLEPYVESRAVLLHEYKDLLDLGMFDLVYTHGCLHHIQTDVVKGVVELLCSCLVPCGKVLALVYTKDFYPNENQHLEGPFARGYTQQELGDLFGENMQMLSYRVFNNGTFSWVLLRRMSS